jgi:sirohydrochlorin ferrochelatase
LARLVADLGARRIFSEVSYGLIKGTPSIGAALGCLQARDVLVYPLFLADGYFARNKLPRLVAAAPGTPGRAIRILPPLGLDPALVDVIAARIAAAGAERAIESGRATVIVLAHGSTSDGASRSAAERIVQGLRGLRRYRDVRAAFLEEPPALGTVLADTHGPVMVVGLFAHDGLHGSEDTAQMIARAARSDVGFVGNVGTWPEIADLIAAAACGASRDRLQMTSIST